MKNTILLSVSLICLSVASLAISKPRASIGHEASRNKYLNSRIVNGLSNKNTLVAGLSYSESLYMKGDTESLQRADRVIEEISKPIVLQFGKTSPEFVRLYALKRQVRLPKPLEETEIKGFNREIDAVTDLYGIDSPEFIQHSVGMLNFIFDHIEKPFQIDTVVENLDARKAFLQGFSKQIKFNTLASSRRVAKKLISVSERNNTPVDNIDRVYFYTDLIEFAKGPPYPSRLFYEGFLKTKDNATPSVYTKLSALMAYKLALSYDSGKDKNQLKAFLEKHKVTLDSTLDEPSIVAASTTDGKSKQGAQQQRQYLSRFLPEEVAFDYVAASYMRYAKLFGIDDGIAEKHAKTIVSLKRNTRRMRNNHGKTSRQYADAMMNYIRYIYKLPLANGFELSPSNISRDLVTQHKQIMLARANHVYKLAGNLAKERINWDSLVEMKLSQEDEHILLHIHALKLIAKGHREGGTVDKLFHRMIDVHEDKTRPQTASSKQYASMALTYLLAKYHLEQDNDAASDIRKRADTLNIDMPNIDRPGILWAKVPMQQLSAKTEISMQSIDKSFAETAGTFAH